MVPELVIGVVEVVGQKVVAEVLVSVKVIETVVAKHGPPTGHDVIVSTVVVVAKKVIVFVALIGAAVTPGNGVVDGTRVEFRLGTLRTLLAARAPLAAIRPVRTDATIDKTADFIMMMTERYECCFKL